MANCHPTRSPPTFIILGGLVLIDGLDRRRFGEVSNAPHIRIDGVLDRVPTPGVLKGNQILESGIALAPGVGDIAVHMSVRYLDSSVKLTAQESRLPVRDRVEWRPWWGLGLCDRASKQDKCRARLRRGR